MRKLFRIGMYFFILNLLFGNSQTKEIESTQIPVLKVEKNPTQIENFKKAIDYGKLNNVEVKITINGGK